MTNKRIDYQIGDRINQRGDNNIGVIRYRSGEPRDPQAALRELVAAARALQRRVGDADRDTIEESLNSLGASADDGPSDHGRLRRVLATIAGVAQLAGDVGAPVVEAVRKVVEAFQA